MYERGNRNPEPLVPYREHSGVGTNSDIMPPCYSKLVGGEVEPDRAKPSSFEGTEGHASTASDVDNDLTRLGEAGGMSGENFGKLLGVAANELLVPRGGSVVACFGHPSMLPDAKARFVRPDLQAGLTDQLSGPM